MKEKELRRTLAVFPIGSVMKLTDLTARQIRYYEDQQAIHIVERKHPTIALCTIWSNELLVFVVANLTSC